MRLCLIILFSVVLRSYSQCDLGIDSRKKQQLLWSELSKAKKSNDHDKSKKLIKELTYVSCLEDSLYRRALSYRMILYVYENAYSDGIAFADSVVPLLTQAKTDIYLAEIIYHQGLCYYRKRNWLKSQEVFERLKENSGLYFNDDNQLHFSINNMIAQCYRRNDLNRALDIYKENLRFLGEDASHSLVSLTYHNIASIYKHKWDFAQEEFYLKAAIQERTKEPGYNKEELAHSYNNLGVNYSAVGESRKAIESYLKAIEIYESLETYKQARLWLTYVNISVDYFELGYADKAIEYCQKAVSILKSEKSINHTNLQYSYSILARAHRLNGENDKALKLFKLSVEKDGGMIAGNLARFANYYQEVGDLHAANNCIDQAIHYMATKERLDPSNNYPVPSIESILPKASALNILKRKPAICLELYEKTRQSEYLETAFQFALFNMKLLNKKKLQAINNSSIVQLIDKHYSIYSQLIKLGLMMYERTKKNYYLNIANSALEHSKQGVLQKLLLTKIEDVYPTIDNKLLREESIIKQKQNTLNNLLESARFAQNQSLIDSIKVELAKTDLDRISIEKQVYDLYPEYAEIKYSINSPGIEDKQAFLQDNAKLIEFHIDRPSGKLISFAFTNNSFNYTIKDLDTSFFTEVNQFLSMNKQVQTDASLFQDIGHKLYKVLLGDNVSKKDETLIISPSDILYLLPFDALISSRVPHPQFNTLNYLVLDHNISVSPMFLTKGNRASMYNSYNGFAPVRFKGHIDLPNSAGELSKSDKNYLYLDASESALKLNVSSTDILHVASHGILNDSMPLQSHLILNPDNKNDGVLHAYEVFSMDVPSKLVILSACNTGVGKMYKGEGVMSMTKAFQFAGAQSVIMSLWAVDDVSSSSIIKDFLASSSTGKTLDLALSSSKRAYIQNSHPLKAHPYYWAGLQLNGEMSAIYPSNNTNTSSSELWWTAATLGLLAFIGLAYSIFNKKSRSDN